MFSSLILTLKFKLRNFFVVYKNSTEFLNIFRDILNCLKLFEIAWNWNWMKLIFIFDLHHDVVFAHQRSDLKKIPKLSKNIYLEFITIWYTKLWSCIWFDYQRPHTEEFQWKRNHIKDLGSCGTQSAIN